MDKIEKICQEIAQLKGVKLYTFSDILSEEPDKSLEEAAMDAICMAFGCDPAYYGNKAEFSVTELYQLFIAGAKWQKDQMLKEAVEGFIFQSEDYYPKELIARYDGELKHGDKVRIIVLPKED